MASKNPSPSVAQKTDAKLTHTPGSMKYLRYDGASSFSLDVSKEGNNNQEAMPQQHTREPRTANGRRKPPI